MTAKSTAVKCTKAFITVVVSATLLYILYENRELMARLKSISLFDMALITFLVVATFFLNSLQVLAFVKRANASISCTESFSLHMTMSLLNYTPVQAGSITRFHYLKKVHNVDYAHFSGILGFRILLLLVATGTFGLFGQILQMNQPIDGWARTTLLFTLMVCTPIAIICASKHLSKIAFIQRIEFLRTLTAVQMAHSEDRKLSIIILTLLLFQFTLIACRFWLCFSFMAVEISTTTLIILPPLSVLVSMLSLTPGAIGLREWALGLTSAALGAQFTDAIFAISIDRAIMLISTFAIGPVCVARVFRKLKKSTKS